MTVGLIPSQDNLQPQTKIPENQDNRVSSTRKPSSPVIKFRELIELSIRYPEGLKLGFQCVLTLVILGFCIIQLGSGGRDGKGKNDALYWGGITSILAWWMPSPGSGGSRNQANVIGGDINLETPKATDNPPPDRKSAPEEEKPY